MQYGGDPRMTYRTREQLSTSRYVYPYTCYICGYGMHEPHTDSETNEDICEYCCEAKPGTTCNERHRP